MKIIVIGCGKIGTTLLASLVAEGHDVVALDSNPDVINYVTNTYDVMGINGNGTDSVILAEAGVNEAELVISTTGSDEFNMLACFIAKRMGAAHTIARIRTPEYNERGLNFLKEQLELSHSINPELLTAKEIFNILRLPSAVKIETFAAKKFEILEIRLKEGSPFVDQALSSLRSKYTARFLICTVLRDDMAYIPDGNFVLKSGDKIGILASHSEIHKLFREIGSNKNKIKNVMILGGNRTSRYLAKMLEATGTNVTIIENDKNICNELCESLQKTVVINADGLNQDVLLEEGLLSQDAFIAVSGSDEKNILLSSFAAGKNIPKVITKVNNDDLVTLSEHWGLDCVINPKQLVSDLLMQYARALHNSEGSSMETLYKLMDGKVEALGFLVKSDFSKLGVPFKDLQIKPNVLIAGIVRDRKPIIPSGDSMLFAGDKVVILAANQRISNLSEILK